MISSRSPSSSEASVPLALTQGWAGSRHTDPQQEYVRTVEVSSLGDPEAPTGSKSKSRTCN